MKKVTVLSFILILILFSVAASAQRGSGDRRLRYRTAQGFNSGQVTRPEKFQLRKDMVRTNLIQRNVRRDGVVTPFEKRRVQQAKCKTRHDAFRFRHNNRIRVI